MSTDWNPNDQNMNDITEEIKKANKKILRKARKRDKKEMCNPPIPPETTKVLNDTIQVANKYISLLECDDDCQYEKKKQELLLKKKEVENIYNTAPKQLRSIQKQYYNHISKRENIDYDTFQENNVDKLLKHKIQNYKDKFNEIIKIIENLNITKTSEINTHIQDLKNMYVNDSSISQRKKDTEELKVADRKAYYLNNGIYTFKILNIICIFCIFCLFVSYYIIYIYIYQQSFTNVFLKNILFLIAFIIITIIYIMINEEKILFKKT